MSVISGLFTSPGQAAQTAQTNRNSGIASDYAGLFGQASDMAGGFLNDLGHFNLGHQIGTALNAMNQDPSQRVAQFGKGATESAANNAAQTANFLRSQGYGDGAVGGAGAGLYQQAAAQTNAYSAQQMDPQEQLQRLMAVLQGAQGGASLYNGLLSQYAQGAYGQPQVQAGSSPFASILGSFGGNYLSALGTTLGSGKSTSKAAK